MPDRKDAGHLGGSLADALFPRVRQRVLALLYGHPDRSFYANEVIEWVDAGSGAVQRELARLTAAGLLTVSRIGRQKHYRANQRAPIYTELRGIVLKTSGLRDILRAALEPFGEKVGAAFIFGSIAKGEDTAESDVDLMVMSDELTYADLFGALEEASGRIGRSVNPTIRTTAELRLRLDQRNAFLTRVLEQPRIWLIGTDDDLASR